jgi:glycosyltransferase involved in cell wall biosynthesis
LDVTVIAGYPATSNGDPLPARETRNGVRVIRARGTRLAPRKFIGRALNYVTYFFSALWAGIRLPRQDVTVGLTDPPIIGLAALAARPRRGMVFYCQDIFPEVAGLLEDFHSPAINAMLEHLNRFLVRRAVRIITLGDTMTARLVEGKGAEASKITVISNWADTAAIVPSDRHNSFAAAHGLDGKFVVLHAGNIGLSQNLDVVIDAAALLASRPDILILFIGDGNRKAALETAVAARGLANVRFLPFQPRESTALDVRLERRVPGVVEAGTRRLHRAQQAVSDPGRGTSLRRGGGSVDRSGGADHAPSLRRDRRTGRCGAARRRDPAAGRSTDEREAMGARARVASELFGRERQVAAHAQLIEQVAGR